MRVGAPRMGGRIPEMLGMIFVVRANRGGGLLFAKAGSGHKKAAKEIGGGEAQSGYPMRQRRTKVY